MNKAWEFDAGRAEPRMDWKPGRFLPPEIQLTADDLERIAVAKRLNSITRAYILGLLAGLRRGQATVDFERTKAEALQRAIDRT